MDMKRRTSAHPPSIDRSIDSVEGRPGADDLCGEAWFDGLFDATHLGTIDRIVADRVLTVMTPSR